MRTHTQQFARSEYLAHLANMSFNEMFDLPAGLECSLVCCNFIKKERKICNGRLRPSDAFFCFRVGSPF